MAATYEDSTTIAASPQEVFAYVADVAHLPDYLTPITEAAPRPLAEGTETDPDVQDATGVHLVGEIKGHRFENDGWFLADESARTLRWGAQAIQEQSGDRDPVHEALGATLQSVEQQVEGTGGKVTLPEPPGDLTPPGS